MVGEKREMASKKRLFCLKTRKLFKVVKINRKIYTPGTKAREMYVHELNIYFEFLFLMSIYSHLKAFIKIVV